MTTKQELRAVRQRIINLCENSNALYDALEAPDIPPSDAAYIRTRLADMNEWMPRELVRLQRREMELTTS